MVEHQTLHTPQMGVHTALESCQIVPICTLEDCSIDLPCERRTRMNVKQSSSEEDVYVVREIFEVEPRVLRALFVYY